MGKYLFAALAALACVVSADACTGMYVGRRASASGAAMLCRTVDTPPTTRLFRNVVRERVENAPGRVCKGFHGFSWPLPATTWKYVCTPATTSNEFGDFASLGINEKGLAVSATVTGYSCEGIRKADPFVKSGLSEDSMTGLIAASCATAHEAVDLIAAIMAKAGGREGNIIMLADPSEAWYVETYSGHQWAAVKMPEDKAAVFGNEYNIRAFDPSAPDVRSSPDLVAMPEKAGLLVRAKDAPIDVFRTYGGKVHADFAHYRTWYGHRRFMPEGSVGDYARELDLPHFFAPSHKIAAEEVFELFRSRNEGTTWCPEETRRQDVRVIGDETQCTCHVIEVRDGVPAPLACTAWFTLGAAEHTVFLPVTVLTRETDPSFANDSKPGAKRNGYDADVAAAHFRRLAALAEQDRVFDGRGVRDYWRTCEAALLKAEDAARTEAVGFYAKSPAQAEEFLTQRTLAIQRAALADAKGAFDALCWYLTENNSARRYSHNYHTFVLTPFPPRKPFAYADGKLQALLAKPSAAAVPVSSHRRTPGLIGGMGPAAACDLMQKIIDNTDAQDDQHHVHLLVDQDTDVPDRTAAILKGGADPMPELVRSARRLEAAGADFLCLSCNTAHYFHERLSKEVSIPILNMPAESARELRRRGIRKVGLLATDGTIRTGVYHKYLKAEGIEVVVPEGENQATVMTLIYGCVKKGVPAKDYPADAVARTVAELRSRGAEAFLLACTELPIAFERLGYRDGFVDPTLVLARAVIREAGAPLKGGN